MEDLRYVLSLPRILEVNVFPTSIFCQAAYRVGYLDGNKKVTPSVLQMLGFISLIATDGWQWFSALQAAKGANL